MNKLVPCLLVLCVGIPLWASDVVETIVCRVNGDIITLSELSRQREALRQELMSQNRYTGIQLQAEIQSREKDLLKDRIDALLLQQKGKEIGINVDAEVIKQLDSIRKRMNLKDMDELEKAVVAGTGQSFEDYKNDMKNNLLTRQVMSREVGSKIQVNKDDVGKFYEEHKKEMEHPEQVWVRDILIAADSKKDAEFAAAKQKATDLAARARKGEDFGALAAKESADDKTKENGGDMGQWWKKGEVDPSIEKVWFASKKGDITDPVATGSGWMIFKIEDHQQAGIPELKDVENQIQEQIYMEKMQPAMRDYLTKLRDEAYMELRPGYIDTGAAKDDKGNYKASSSFHLIPVDAPQEDLTTTVARAKKGSGKKIYKPWSWVHKTGS